MQTVFQRADGSEIAPDPRCELCSALHEARERVARRLDDVKAADDSRRQEWRLTCGLGDLHKTLDGFDGTRQPKAFKALAEWSGESLVLASPGTFGVGKTHLVAALAHFLIETSQAAVSIQGNVVRLPRPCLFTTEQRILGRIRATFNANAAEIDEQVYLEMEKIRLLIVDDVGKVRPRDTSFLEQVWYRIIDGRYIAGRPVVLTTNLSLDELESHLGGAVSDRLREMCGRQGFITMKGQSYRRQK